MNDLELIRSFRSDVEPPDAERIAAARAKLLAECAQAAPAPARRRLPRARHNLRARLVLLGAPVLAAVAALVLAGGLGGRGSDEAGAAIIHRAGVALALPSHMVLHTKVAGDGFESEFWQLTNPPYSFVAAKGPVGVAQPEEAANATSSSYYDPSTNTIHELPNVVPPQFADPIAQVRQRLNTGDARVLGSAEVDGIATYAIQFKDKDGYDVQSLVAYVDQHTYRPIVLSDPQRNGSVVRLRVVVFEYLPATRANLALLSLPARHPTARVVKDPGSAKAAPAGK